MSKLTTFITRGKNLESLHDVKCFVSSLDGKKLFGGYVQAPRYGQIP